MSFINMGKPISETSREAAYQWLKSIGFDMCNAMHCVSSVANHLGRDNPFLAQKQALAYLDLTGSYRLLAILLTEQTE